MIESEDKGIPLMTPTFFDCKDPNNPKFIDSKVTKDKILEVPYSVYKVKRFIRKICKKQKNNFK